MINSNERIRIFRYLLQDRVFPEVGIFLFEIFDFYRRIESARQAMPKSATFTLPSRRTMMF